MPRNVTPVPQVLKKLTSNVGADLVFEASGTAELALQMLDMVRARGEIVLLGIHREPHSLNLLQATFKGIVLKGIRVYRGLDYEKALELLSSKKIGMSSLILHIFSLDKSLKAFDLVKKVNKSMKILLKP